MSKWAGLVSCVLIFLAFMSDFALAQDIIYPLKGAEIKCKVQEIGEDSVSYIMTDAATIKFMIKKAVAKIKYANGYEEVLNAPAPAKENAISTTVNTKAGAGDIIFTADGKQLVGKVTEIEDNIISYVLNNDPALQKIETKNVLEIKYQSGFEEFYNGPGRKQNLTNVKTIKNDESPADKDSLLIVLQNWKRKYISPPLEIL